MNQGLTLSVAGRQIRILTFVLVIALLFPSDALAYLDPGTGSLVVQSLIAALAAVGYGLRLYWGRLRVWMKRRPAPTDPPEPALRTTDLGQ
jgi:hypothetical protein